MKRSMLVLAIFGVLASRAVFAQQVCPGAEGGSPVCAPACSNQIVNDDVPGSANQGKFNVGGGNQGDGNDGFNNLGSFNIGSANRGNCNAGSGLNVGSCDPSNNNGQIVLRFCRVLPSDPKCSPAGYLAEFTPALRTQIAAVVASCNGGAPVTPTPTTTSAPATPPTSPLAPTPAGSTPPRPSPVSPAPVLPPSSTPIKNKENFLELLELFAQKLQADKSGRKLKL